MNSTSGPIIGLEEYASDEELKSVELFVGYPDPLLKFVSVCCVIFILIGVPGNLITIVALARFKKILNATAIFIINLSVVDLLFCSLVLPMVVFSYWTHYWIHGKVLCRLFPLLNYVFVIVSLYTAVAIAINRYVLICHPIHYCSIYTRRNIYIMISILWIFATGALLLPFFELWGRMSLDAKTGACTMVEDKYNRNPKKTLVTVLFFVALFVILGCYIRILIVVKKSVKRSNNRVPGAIEVDCTTDYNTNTLAEHSQGDTSSSSDNTEEYSVVEMSNSNGQHDGASEMRDAQGNRMAKKKLPSKKDRKLRTMVYAIMICLFLCYVPITVTKLLYKNIETSPSINMIGYILIYSAPCINPVLYVFISKEYRQAYKSLFRLKK